MVVVGTRGSKEKKGVEGEGWETEIAKIKGYSMDSIKN